MLISYLSLALLAPPVDLDRVPADAKVPVQNYYHSDYMMQPVCTELGVNELLSSTKRIVGSREARRAWVVALTVFCGTSRESKRFLVWHATKKIRFEVYPGVTDDGPTVTLIDAFQVLMLNGNAWAAAVDGGPNRLRYSYGDGFCGGAFDLKKVNGYWLIVGFSEACD